VSENDPTPSTGCETRSHSPHVQPGSYSPSPILEQFPHTGCAQPATPSNKRCDGEACAVEHTQAPRLRAPLLTLALLLW